MEEQEKIDLAYLRTATLAQPPSLVISGITRDLYIRFDMISHAEVEKHPETGPGTRIKLVYMNGVEDLLTTEESRLFYETIKMLAEQVVQHINQQRGQISTQEAQILANQMGLKDKFFPRGKRNQ